MAGLALGAAGFLAGGLVGAALDSNCRCDSPGFGGFLRGAPIGAGMGAAIGVVLAR